MSQELGFVDHLVDKTESRVIIKRLIFLKQQYIFLVRTDGGILLDRLYALMLLPVILRLLLQFLIQLIDLRGLHGIAHRTETAERSYE